MTVIQKTVIQKDQDAKRDRLWRWIEVSVLSVVIIAGPGILLFGFFRLAGWNEPNVWVFIVAVLIGGEMYAQVLPRRLLNIVPQVQGFVSQEVISGDMIPYGPGLHPARITERRDVKSNVSLEAVGFTVAVTIPTSTSGITVTSLVQYLPALENIETFVSYEPSEIEAAYASFFREWFTGKCIGRTTEEILKGDNFAAMSDEIRVKFLRGAEGAEFSKRYGVRVLEIRNTPALPPEVQKARDAQSEAAVAFAGIANLYGMTSEELRGKIQAGSISHEQYGKMLDKFLVQSGNAGMTVVSGTAGDAIAALVANQLKGGGK